MEVKHLVTALGGPHEYLGAPKDPFSGVESLFVYSVFIIRYSCLKIFVIFGICVFELFADL